MINKIETLLDIHKFQNKLDKEWLVTELNDFLEWIKTFEEDEGHSCNNKGKIKTDWFDYIHAKLNEYGFVNGEPEENTWEKRPKARFWWIVYATHINYYHTSPMKIKDEMIEVIKYAINNVK